VRVIIKDSTQTTLIGEVIEQIEGPRE